MHKMCPECKLIRCTSHKTQSTYTDGKVAVNPEQQINSHTESSDSSQFKQITLAHADAKANLLLVIRLTAHRSPNNWVRIDDP
ncbi:hypothetical protein M5D96_007979 [Drosophila gunungcola]|uniref:Uncharacterized protein n=1 Tax=Drosophila gunungcola TaxID=103775 RepID=A0A9P9YLT0_9MUSC|nr:hypothetical protein M5D96_007979 [Drosophila gunungcola]